MQRCVQWSNVFFNKFRAVFSSNLAPKRTRCNVSALQTNASFQHEIFILKKDYVSSLEFNDFVLIRFRHCILLRLSHLVFYRSRPSAFFYLLRSRCSLFVSGGREEGREEANRWFFFSPRNDRSSSRYVYKDPAFSPFSLSLFSSTSFYRYY